MALMRRGWLHTMLDVPPLNVEGKGGHSDGYVIRRGWLHTMLDVPPL